MSIIGFWIDEINSKRIDTLVKEKYIKISNELFQNIENKTQFEASHQFASSIISTTTL